MKGEEEGGGIRARRRRMRRKLGEEKCSMEEGEFLNLKWGKKNEGERRGRIWKLGEGESSGEEEWGDGE